MKYYAIPEAVNGNLKGYQLWELKSVPPPLEIVHQAVKAVIFSPPEV